MLGSFLNRAVGRFDCRNKNLASQTTSRVRITGDIDWPGRNDPSTRQEHKSIVTVWCSLIDHMYIVFVTLCAVKQHSLSCEQVCFARYHGEASSLLFHAAIYVRENLGPALTSSFAARMGRDISAATSFSFSVITTPSYSSSATTSSKIASSQSISSLSEFVSISSCPSISSAIAVRSWRRNSLSSSSSSRKSRSASRA
jgi:hypothetical protein